MRLDAFYIDGFRSYREVWVEFSHETTTLVGENNTGKSSLIDAIRIFCEHLSSGGDHIGISDLPYGQPHLITMAARIRVSEQDIPFLASHLKPGRGTDKYIRMLTGPVTVEVIRSPDGSRKMLLQNENVTASWKAENPHFDGKVAAGSEQGTGFIYPFPHPLGLELAARLRILAEFRSRDAGGRSGALETSTGSETASVLLNLKNHHERSERDRYRLIIESFQKVFPRYQVEAVQQSPAGAADIQFTELDRAEPLALGSVSAGIQQVLMLLTNVIGRQGLILVIEHPEQHLHPHAMRFLLKLLREASSRNQIIVTTHDPHFIDPDSLNGLRRVWWTPQTGTQIWTAEAATTPLESAQFKTVMRGLTNREMMFARAVLVVEDESQQEFVTGIAPTLGYDLDALCISVVPVHGEGGYGPYLATLRALGIPHVALKDKDWGDTATYPPARFFSFGMELEEYLDGAGLRELREVTMKEHGLAKRRVAGLLAARIEREKVPPLFEVMLERVSSLATGEPLPLPAS
jgi:predicted ATPase